MNEYWKLGFPDKDGEYLVTTNKGEVKIEFFSKESTADHPYPSWYLNDVVAWMEKPEKYEKRKEI